MKLSSVIKEDDQFNGVEEKFAIGEPSAGGDMVLQSPATATNGSLSHFWEKLWGCVLHLRMYEIPASSGCLRHLWKPSRRSDQREEKVV